jgi:hypothetical protein
VKYRVFLKRFRLADGVEARLLYEDLRREWSERRTLEKTASPAESEKSADNLGKAVREDHSTRRT